MLYSFDQFHRLTGIAVNNTPVYGYTLNAKDQRTAATLPDGKTWDYSYDGMGQVAGGVKKTATGVTLDTLAYAYDTIGNRTSSTEDGTTRAYTANNINQYTALTNPAMSPTYDADGNMLTNGAWSYTWNAGGCLFPKLFCYNPLCKLKISPKNTRITFLRLSPSVYRRKYRSADFVLL